VTRRPSRRAGRAWRSGVGPLLALLASCGAEAPSPAPPAPPALPPFTVRGRWADAHAIPYRVDDTGSPLAPGALAAAVRRAIELWCSDPQTGFVLDEDAPAVVFSWSPDGTDARGDDFGDDFGGDTGVARTGPVGPGCRVLFDASRDWDPASGGPSLERAAVHELGHVLGLDHVEAEGSAMHPQWQRASAVPGPGDRAGLRSLYGGGPDAPGDLRAGDLALRDVAPPGAADWTVFDTDGDGSDELLVWDTATDRGALTVYRFGPGPRLAGTDGPWLAIAGPGARLACGVDGSGRRVLDVRWPDGSSQRRVFDADGRLAGALGTSLAGEPWPRRTAGDLDGDGRPESVRLVQSPRSR